MQIRVTVTMEATLSGPMGKRCGRPWAVSGQGTHSQSKAQVLGEKVLIMSRPRSFDKRRRVRGCGEHVRTGVEELEREVQDLG